MPFRYDALDTSKPEEKAHSASPPHSATHPLGCCYLDTCTDIPLSLSRYLLRYLGDANTMSPTFCMLGWLGGWLPACLPACPMSNSRHQRGKEEAVQFPKGELGE